MVLGVQLDRSWEEAPNLAAAAEGEILARFETVPDVGPPGGEGRLRFAQMGRLPSAIPRRATSVTVEIRIVETDLAMESYVGKEMVRLDFRHPTTVTIRGSPAPSPEQPSDD
jgi:hypothetical protein